MKVSEICAQLRTTDLERSIAFYIEKLGFQLQFRFRDFDAGIKAGEQSFHLKLVDSPDPWIDSVNAGHHLHLLFTVEDVDAVAAKLAERRVGLLGQPEDTS